MSIISASKDRKVVHQYVSRGSLWVIFTCIFYVFLYFLNFLKEKIFLSYLEKEKDEQNNIIAFRRGSKPETQKPNQGKSNQNPKKHMPSSPQPQKGLRAFPLLLRCRRDITEYQEKAIQPPVEAACSTKQLG